MSYVSQFQYDVFISYRQVDNQFGWVTRLEETLQCMLKAHARPKGREVWDYEIFRDNREIGGNKSLPDEIRQAVTSSATFVIVMSENYLDTDSDWCRRERELLFQTLGSSAQASGRIFIVRMSGVSEKCWPAELRNFTGYQFWEKDSESGEVQPLSFDFGKSGRVPVACQRFGDELWETLDQFRTSGKPTTLPSMVSVNRTPASSERPIVFLAEVTDELHNDRSQFVSFLEQEGFCVVPGKNQRYRFEPEAARAELPEVLKQATLVVQMHGGSPMASDEQFENGFERWLFEQAQAAGKIPGQTLLRWRRQGLLESQIQDADHRAFAYAADVIAEDLAQFKPMVAKRAGELLKQSTIQVHGHCAKVIVSTRQNDKHKAVTDELVDEIDMAGAELAPQAVESAVVFDTVPLQLVTQEFEKQQAPTKAFMVVHADADEDWVQQRMRECRLYQLKKTPRPPCAVYVDPPDDQPHPSTVPGRFEVIRRGEHAKLQAFLTQLAAEGTP